MNKYTKALYRYAIRDVQVNGSYSASISLWSENKYTKDQFDEIVKEGLDIIRIGHRKDELDKVFNIAFNGSKMDVYKHYVDTGRYDIANMKFHKQLLAYLILDKDFFLLDIGRYEKHSPTVSTSTQALLNKVYGLKKANIIRKEIRLHIPDEEVSTYGT